MIQEIAYSKYPNQSVKTICIILRAVDIANACHYYYDFAPAKFITSALTGGFSPKSP